MEGVVGCIPLMTTIVVISFSSDEKSGDNMYKAKIRDMNKHVYNLLVELKLIQPIIHNVGLLGKEILRAK